MDEQVQAEVSTETPAPAVTETADPTDAKIQAAIEAFKKTQETEIARKVQSEADKRVAPLQRRLQDYERRNQNLEGIIRTFPAAIDDPDARMKAEMAALRGQVNYYEQDRQVATVAQREDEAKQAALQAMRDEIAELGLNPDDPRIPYDLDQPDPSSFRRKALQGAKQALKEDSTRDLEATKAQLKADLLAQLRKETGVDSQDSTETAATKPAFTRAQINDRKFWEDHKAEILQAQAEGRIKE